MIASKMGDQRLVEYLLGKKANVNLRNIYGDTPYSIRKTWSIGYSIASLRIKALINKKE